LDIIDRHFAAENAWFDAAIVQRQITAWKERS
jgi:hypothetical protein